MTETDRKKRVNTGSEATVTPDITHLTHQLIE